MPRLRALLARVEAAVFEGAAKLAPETRKAVAAGDVAGSPLAALVEKVHRHAYRVTDEDVAALRAAGHSEDELFEAIVAAAMGAGLVRLRAGLRVVGREP